MEIIRVKDLSKTYEFYKKEEGVKGSLKNLMHKTILHKEAVKHINFTINKGDMVGFIGLNGAGKTTTLKMLSGILKPTSGEIDILGFYPFEKKYEFLKKIGIVMGNKTQLWWDIPAIDSFALNKELYEVPDAQYKETLYELVEMMNVEHLLHTQVRRLSLGERMKMELILSLIHSPDIIFLDEPTIGLDVVSQYNIREVLKKYNERHNTTVILTSHNLDDIETVCQKLMLINQGELVFNGSLDNFVEKQSLYKIVRVKCKKDKQAIKERIKDFSAEIIDETHDEIKIQVEKDASLKLSSTLMNDYIEQIRDISIESTDMQELVRKFYS